MIEPTRKLASAALAITIALCGAAQAQNAAFPTHAMTIVIPFPPGGTSDVLARLMGEKVTADLGQPLVVVNKSGGDGIIGAEFVARSKPDGYTTVQISTTHIIVPSLRKDMPYDWKTDFTPIFGPSGVPEVLAVSGKSNFHSIDDLIAYAKNTSGGINYASSSTGSTPHLLAAQLVQRLKMKATHVPYRGLTPEAKAIMGGEVQFGMLNAPDIMDLVKSGNLRLLAITSDTRASYLPDVPTMKELGYPELTATSWTVILAPAGTPPDVAKRLHDAFAKAVATPDLKARLDEMGVNVGNMNTADLSRFLNDESERWHRTVEDNHITLDAAPANR